MLVFVHPHNLLCRSIYHYEEKEYKYSLPPNTCEHDTKGDEWAWQRCHPPIEFRTAALATP